MPKQTKSRRLTNAAFREVRRQEPARVSATRFTDGDAAAERQLRAIALEKARANGARIRRAKKA